jgi:hypothetical protein
VFSLEAQLPVWVRVVLLVRLPELREWGSNSQQNKETEVRKMNYDGNLQKT